MHSELNVQAAEYSQKVIDRLSSNERRYLFESWVRPKLTHEADERLRRLESVGLKLAREALHISVCELAARLEMTPNAYLKLEKRASSGTASVAHLLRAADALECDCVVIFRPKKNRTFAERIWVPLLNQAVETKWFATIPDSKLIYALPKRLRELLFDAKFRRSQNWSRQHHDGRRPAAWYL